MGSALFAVEGDLPRRGRQDWSQANDLAAWQPRTEGGRQPALVINGPAAHDLEVLRPQAALRCWVVERVGEADTVDRVLLHTVDHARWRDAEDLVDGRHQVVAVVELGARGLVVRDLGGPAHRHRVAGATHV
jgi:hypothetical protein